LTEANNDFTHRDGVSLRQYIETLIDAQCRKCELCRESINDRFESTVKLNELMAKHIDEATNLARIGMERRLEGMNEFRDALKDQTARMATRLELEAFGKDVRELREFAVEVKAKASQKSVYIAWAFSFISIIIAVISLILIIK